MKLLHEFMIYNYFDIQGLSLTKNKSFRVQTKKYVNKNNYKHPTFSFHGQRSP